MTDLRATLDAIVHRSQTPGLQYAAVNRDGTLFEYAGGWADLARRLPMTPDTTMMAYSMSKTITAAAVLQLVETQKIDLDAPIDRYVDSQPYGPGVTVRGLLSHTAGIPNPIPLRWVHPVAEHSVFREEAALAEVLKRHGRRSSEPGTKFAYSNIGYWLLGPIVEKASGEPFTSYVDRHVLRPLGIEPKGLGYAVIDQTRHATGYLEKYSVINLIKGLLIDRSLIGDYAGTWLEIRGHYLNGPAFGGLVGTARSFGMFLRDELQPHSCLFDDRTRSLFCEPQQTKRGSSVPMTPGWHVGALDGARVFFKEGGGGGFHCMMRMYPERGIGTVVMTNATGFDVRRLLDTIDRPLLSSASTRHL